MWSGEDNATSLAVSQLMYSLVFKKYSSTIIGQWRIRMIPARLSVKFVEDSWGFRLRKEVRVVDTDAHHRIAVNLMRVGHHLSQQTDVVSRPAVVANRSLDKFFQHIGAVVSIGFNGNVSFC